MDFNPGAYPSSNITLTISSDHTVVLEYQNVTQYGEGASTSRVFNFDVVLATDGSILFQWRMMPNISGYALSRWTSAIRPVEGRGSYVITAEQESRARTEWMTNTTGVYPSIANVATGRETLFCPLSTTWCLTPSVVYSSQPPSYITLTPASISCLKDLEFAYYVAGHRSATMTPCSVSPSSILNCSGSGVATVAGASAQAQIQIAWRAKGESAYADLSAEPLIILVTASTAPSSPYEFSSNNNCTVNGVYCADSPCEFCNRNFTCLDLPCTALEYSDALNPILLPDLYRDLSCDNTCSTEFETDRNGVCCLARDLDCTGTCNGTAAVSLAEEGDEYVCCTAVVDCFNVCNGPALYDTCGVCRSPGDEMSYCNTYFSVNTGFSDYGIYAYYGLSVQDNKIVSSPFESVIAFNNSNNTEVTLTMALYREDSSKAPVVQIPALAYSVPPYSAMNVSIISSIETLLIGNSSSWESKIIRIRYKRPAVFTYEIVIDVHLFPNAKNCDLVNAPSLCVDIPGCILCHTTGGYRVLRVSGEAEAGVGRNDESDSTAPCYATEVWPTVEAQRNLFGNVIPGSVNGNKGEDSVSGMCADGWLTSDCKIYSFESQEPGIDSSTVGHVVIASVLIGFVFASTYLFYSI
jgi:hypothetical protein